MHHSDLLSEIYSLMNVVPSVRRWYKDLLDFDPNLVCYHCTQNFQVLFIVGLYVVPLFGWEHA